MPAPVTTPISPLAGATGVSTSVPVVVRVTATLPAVVVEKTVQVAIGPDFALDVEDLAADASILAGGLDVTSATRTWGPDDVGAAVWTDGAPDPRDRGKAHIKAIVAANTVRVTRAPLAGTANLTNGLTAVTGIGTTWLADLLPGEWFVVDDAGPAVQVLSVTSNTALTLVNPYAGTTDPAAELTRTFSNNVSPFDWTVQQFRPGFGGVIEPAAGGANGYDVTVWRTQQLTGSATSTGAGFTGFGTAFSSELHAGSRVFMRGKRPSDPYATVATVVGDASCTTSPYAVVAAAGPLYCSRDLPGSSTSQTTQTITVVARDSNGDLAAPGSYTFDTGLRPRVALVDGQVANPFGLAVRVQWSDVMWAASTSLNPALLAAGTYGISVVAGTPQVPSPPVPVITGVTPGPGVNPAYVDLALLAAQTNGAQYRVTVKNVGLRANTGNHVGDAPDDRLDFTGYGPADVLLTVKDTQVARPTITGPVIIPYGTDTVEYDLVDIDVDVVALQLGPSAAGVELVPGSFVSNRLDPDPAVQRTGRVTVRFNQLVQSYRLSVVAIDDVDNVSAESDVLGITVEASTVPGTALMIRPHDPVHHDTCQRLLDDVPAGTFFLRSGFTIPYTIDPVPFRLDVVEPGRPVTIAITRDGPTVRPESRYQTVIPTGLVETVMLTLGRGRNLIYATDGTRHDYIVVSATTYATVLCAVASEMYAYSQVQLEDVQRAVYGQLSTRLSDLYVDFSDILPFPPVMSQQVASTKMAVRAHVSDAGHERAVRDLGAAITLQTPFLRAVQNPKVRWQPGVDRLHSQQEAFGGFEHHVWWHADCAARWNAFLRFVSNRPDLVRPLDTGEDEIIVKTAAGQYHRHTFDLAAQSCSTVDARETCFDRARVSIVFSGELVIPVCAAVYPFDSCFTPAYPLGSDRATFDSMVPWDSLVPLDHDPLDPGDDGWAGLCWAGRWDSGRELFALADGAIQAGSNSFTSGYSFVAADVGRWVHLASGPRTGVRRIVAVTAGTAHLDRTHDITAAGISWRLLEDVRPLDSMGATPTDPWARLENDGLTSAGTSTFGTAGQYAFTAADLNRNIVVFTPDGPIGLYVMAVLSPGSVQVGRSNGQTVVPYVWADTYTGLRWELWDVRTNACVWGDGYATLVTTLASADIQLDCAPDFTITDAMDGQAAWGFMWVIPGIDLVDGETFTLNDGVNPATIFEFDLGGGGVTPGNVAVVYTAGDTAAQIAQAIVAAVNAVGAGLAITAYWGTSNLVILTNDVHGTAGNQPITETVADLAFVVSGMAGGLSTYHEANATLPGVATLNSGGATVYVTGGMLLATASTLPDGLMGVGSLGPPESSVAHLMTAPTFLTATGSLLARGSLPTDPPVDDASATIVAEGFIWAPGTVLYSAAATLLGAGSVLVPTSSMIHAGSASMTGTGTLLAIGSV